MVQYSFDAEVSQFLQACFEKADIRNDEPSYSTVWAIMKVCIRHWWLSLTLTRVCCEIRKWTICHRINLVQGVCNGQKSGTMLVDSCGIWRSFDSPCTTVFLAY
jgi:hypothetical protein